MKLHTTRQASTGMLSVHQKRLRCFSQRGLILLLIVILVITIIVTVSSVNCVAVQIPSLQNNSSEEEYSNTYDSLLDEKNIPIYNILVEEPSIIIENATNVRNLDLVTTLDAQILEIAEAVEPRIFIEQAGTIYIQDLENIPQELLQITEVVPPRIFIEQAGTIHYRNVEYIPQQVIHVAKTVAPRIFIEHSSTIHHYNMNKPSIITSVLVSGVTLDMIEMSLIIDSAPVQLIANVNPEDATNQAVTWSSNNPSIATVTSNGWVTPIGEGTATITVTTVCGGFTATCVVIIEAPEADWNPWDDTDSEEGVIISLAEIVEAIGHWSNDVPIRGHTMTLDDIIELIRIWADG
jgi:uncharacterized protein YjdB